MAKKASLRRSLNLPLVTLYGLGNILGAGIYVLVGKVAGAAGGSATLAFLIAMAIAGLTAFSYMELASRYPVSASVSVYLHKAFGKRWLSVMIGLAMVISGIASAAALAQGFAGYLGSLLGVPILIASVGIILLVGLVAVKGIGESASVAATFTVVEIVGLLLIVWFGREALSSVNISDIVSIDQAKGVSGVMAGAFLAFYAFIGFEDMVNVAEEVKDPRRTMPRAILLSLAAATALYLAVVIVSIAVIEPAQLASSDAPLADVFRATGASNAYLLNLIGIAAAVNGVVVQLIMGSRILYGLSAQGWIDSRFAAVNGRSKTPVFATMVVTSLMVLGTILLPLVSLAKITSLLVLAIFSLVNISLIKIKRDNANVAGQVSIPAFVPLLGAVCCAALILYEVVA